MSKKKKNYYYFGDDFFPPLRMKTHRTQSVYSPRNTQSSNPLSQRCAVAAVLVLTFLMDTRQMKRTYSGSLCANVLVLHCLWFLPKSKPHSSLGALCCHRWRWRMALAWWVPAGMSGHTCSGRGVACPPLARCPFTCDSCEAVAPRMLALDPSTSGLPAGGQGV